MDEQCKLIDKKARAARQWQEDAHREGERIVRQVDIDRHIRQKELELESAQLVSSVIQQNLSDDDPGGAAPLLPSPT